MVWAAFWGSNRSELVHLEQDFEAKKHGYSAASYLALLEENLPTIYDPSLIFMQDNAPIYTARKVKEWFNNNEGVYDHDPDIKEAAGSNKTKEDCLWKVLEASWDNIGEDI
ncbi:hypothetical protein ARAM_007666 [Aspergillus rambellii]|uniref:Tc1-like transposase DDE domain-containing protein n=1 Tax=Aspergillus rambellii TaxID=308745 RepID=A0A0F8UHS2_9EURO|nr:hypothetical protein ARAM_007666 [Aspergillus rambellii]